jgi:hypothetical protein
MDERREYERKLTSIRVEMSHPTLGRIVGFARDVSDGGASVLVENYQVPPAGTIVDVMFRRVVGKINDQPVKMKIQHIHRNVLGLMFA